MNIWMLEAGQHRGRVWNYSCLWPVCLCMEKSKAWWCRLSGIFGWERQFRWRPAAEMMSSCRCFPHKQESRMKKNRDFFLGLPRSYQLQLFICLLQHFSVSSSHTFSLPAIPLFNNLTPLETTARVRRLCRWLVIMFFFIFKHSNSSPSADCPC